MILIVGGAGYIGSQVNKELNKRGYETLILDNLVNGHIELVKWGKFFEGNMGDSLILDNIFTHNKIDLVMHFGAYKAAGESVIDPEKYYLNNVGNTLKLLESMNKHGVKNLVFSSTAAVYGDPQYNPIDEKHSTSPINPYGMTKLVVEKILESYGSAYGLKFVAFRYFNAAGADPETVVGEWPGGAANLIPVIFDVAMGRKRELKVFGTDYPTADGTCIRDYIHVYDLADAHVRAAEYLQQGGESATLNLGNGKGYSVKEVVDKAKKVIGIDFKVVEEDRRTGDPPVLMADSTMARSVLGWVPKYTDIEEIIRSGWEWEKKM